MSCVHVLYLVPPSDKTNEAIVCHMLEHTVVITQVEQAELVHLMLQAHEC